jgi:hypothetical protein
MAEAKVGRSRLPLIIISGTLIFIAAAVWILSRSATYNAGFSLNGITPVFVKGVVVKNVTNTSDLPVGGTAYLEILDPDNSIQTVYYSNGVEDCSDDAKAIQSGEKVSVYGLPLGNGEYTLCGSSYFKIESLGATGPYAGWSEYEDTAAGFSFKFPGNWTLSTSSRSAGVEADLFPPKAADPALMVVSTGGLGNLRLEDWAQSFYRISPADASYATVGGAEAMVFPASQNNAQSVMLLKHGDYVLEFDFASADANVPKELVAIPALIMKSVLLERIASSTASSSGELKTGLRGAVTISPVCPVEKNPPDPMCAPKPYQAKLRVVAQDGTVVKRFITDAQGAYSVDLDPGIYTVENDASSALPSLAPQRVAVVDHSLSVLNLQFDSGIR